MWGLCNSKGSLCGATCGVAFVEPKFCRFLLIIQGLVGCKARGCFRSRSGGIMHLKFSLEFNASGLLGLCGTAVSIRV